MSAGCKDKRAKSDHQNPSANSQEALMPEDIMQEHERSSKQVTGQVTADFHKFGCDFLIRVDGMTEDDTYGLIYPVALDSIYLKDGMKLKFTYRPSRAFSGKCTKGMPAVIEDVEIVQP